MIVGARVFQPTIKVRSGPCSRGWNSLIAPASIWVLSPSRSAMALSSSAMRITTSPEEISVSMGGFNSIRSSSLRSSMTEHLS
jgi:hypothetical protein